MAKKTAPSHVDRSAKLAELEVIIGGLEETIGNLAESSEQRELLLSVSQGLYEETDKLAKKAPAEQVTDLLMEQVNQVIGETRELITKDPYVQRLNRFIPAGDRPEHRDVVVILRMVLQALARFEPALKRRRVEANRTFKEADVVREAVRHYQQHREVLSRSALEDDFAKYGEGWFVGDTGLFDFDDFDTKNLTEYFELE